MPRWYKCLWCSFKVLSSMQSLKWWEKYCEHLQKFHRYDHPVLREEAARLMRLYELRQRRER